MSSGGFVLVLLGAECTGKSTLAVGLRDALVEQGKDAVRVPEYLREFCAARGRTPQADEQVGIAREQTRRIDLARSRHAIVIADTSALMTAVYSDLFFGDGSLYAPALDAHRVCDVSLLTGMDLPWQADGIQRAGQQSRMAVDARIRDVLGRSPAPYSVVYGNRDRRVQVALAAIRRVPQPLVVAESARWRWICRHCGDDPCDDRQQLAQQ